MLTKVWVHLRLGEGEGGGLTNGVEGRDGGRGVNGVGEGLGALRGAGHCASVVAQSDEVASRPTRTSY